jgi:sporulation protein YlmC with PRC-barrel domain
MAAREAHVELLIGRRVVAANGRSIGRIEEIVARLEDGECRVEEFHLGGYALFERLAAWHLGRAILRTLRLGGPGYRVPWRDLDLSDPDRPRLRCAASALDRL